MLLVSSGWFRLLVFIIFFVFVKSWVPFSVVLARQVHTGLYYTSNISSMIFRQVPSQMSSPQTSNWKTRQTEEYVSKWRRLLHAGTVYGQTAALSNPEPPSPSLVSGEISSLYPRSLDTCWLWMNGAKEKKFWWFPLCFTSSGLEWRNFEWLWMSWHCLLNQLFDNIMTKPYEGYTTFNYCIFVF